MLTVVAFQPLLTSLGQWACTSLERTLPGLRFLDEAAVEAEQLKKEMANMDAAIAELNSQLAQEREKVERLKNPLPADAPSDKDA